MRARVLAAGVPAFQVRSGHVTTHYCPPNLVWEYREAHALAAAGVEVLVGPVRSVIPLAHTDVVFASSQNLAIAAQHVADELGVPWACRLIVPPAPQDGRAQTEQDEALVALLDTAAAIVFPSIWLRDAWASRLVGVSATREVVPHAIEAEEAPSFRRRVAPAALFLGWLVERKRADVVLRCCKAAGVPLTIAGDGPERAGLVQLAAGLDAAVAFAGIVDEDTKARLFYSHGLYVSASEEDYFAIPVGEALAAGCRVLHRRLPALVGVWDDSGVEWWDAEEELVTLLRERRVAVAGAGALWLIEHSYDVKAVGWRLAAVLRDVVG